MQLIHDTAENWLKSGALAKAIFMDPPDNLRLDYDNYSDNLESSAYYWWLRSLLSQACQRASIVFLSYHSKHDFHVSASVLNLLPKGWTAKKILWRYTFGQYNPDDFGSGYRPILRLMKTGTSVNHKAILQTSRRMELGDSRAAGPRLPDDVWDFPRVVGNAKERCSWHPTQHPEALYERIIKYCGEGLFVDLFAGTGTCFRAGKNINKTDIIGVEQSLLYCNKIREQLIKIKE